MEAMPFEYWVMTCVLMVPAIIWASWIDYKERRVPNWLNAAIAFVGFLAQGWYFGLAGISAGALGLLVGFGVLIIPWLMHGMGAGDVKLMMAIGVWLGPTWTAISFAVGGIVGGIIAVAMIVSSGRVWKAWANMQTIVCKMTSRSTIFSEFGGARTFGNTSQLLPYGVPLTIGTLMVFLGRQLMFG